MKKSMLAVLLSLAGVAAHATTVSNLQLPNVGSVPGALVPFGPGVTQQQWALGSSSTDLQFSFDFRAGGALVFAFEQGVASTLFSTGKLDSLNDVIDGVVLAYDPMTGAVGSVSGYGVPGVDASVADLKNQLGSPANQVAYTTNDANQLLSGRIQVLLSDDGNGQAQSTFNLQLRAPGTVDYDTIVSAVLSYSVAPGGVPLFTGGRVAFASFQGTQGGTLALNGVPAAVPEASSVAMTLAGVGVIGLCAARRRQRRN